MYLEIKELNVGGIYVLESGYSREFIPFMLLECENKEDGWHLKVKTLYGEDEWFQSHNCGPYSLKIGRLCIQ